MRNGTQVRADTLLALRRFADGDPRSTGPVMNSGTAASYGTIPTGVHSGRGMSDGVLCSGSGITAGERHADLLASQNRQHRTALMLQPDRLAVSARRGTDPRAAVPAERRQQGARLVE